MSTKSPIISLGLCFASYRTILVSTLSSDHRRDKDPSMETNYIGLQKKVRTK